VRYRHTISFFCVTLTLSAVAAARMPARPTQEKEYLTDAESDKIRDTPSPAARIGLYISFAEDRLKKFEYEVHRSVQERRRTEILNSLLNGYVGCVDDAADQIDDAQEKHVDVREALKSMKTKDNEFLDTLEKYDKDKSGPDFADYQDSLEDAIEGTKDALSDASDAEKETPAAPVRRKQ
jgi:hypothetical protein